MNDDVVEGKIIALKKTTPYNNMGTVDKKHDIYKLLKMESVV